MYSIYHSYLLQRKGKYAHVAFVRIIAEQYMGRKKKSCEGFGDYAASFNPIPGPLIALIATAVECDILSWENGFYTPLDFTEHKFAAIYRRHINNLDKYKKK